MPITCVTSCIGQQNRYMFYNSIINPPQTVTNYYAYDAGYTFSTTSWETLDQPNINITVSKNCSVYISFNCWAMRAPSTMVGFEIQINGISIPQQWYVGGTDSLGGAPNDRDSVALQYYNASLAPGTYEITIRAYKNVAGDTRLYVMSLYVQTIS